MQNLQDLCIWATTKKVLAIDCWMDTDHYISLHVFHGELLPLCSSVALILKVFLVFFKFCIIQLWTRPALISVQTHQHTVTHPYQFFFYFVNHLLCSFHQFKVCTLAIRLGDNQADEGPAEGRCRVHLGCTAADSTTKDQGCHHKPASPCLLWATEGSQGQGGCQDIWTGSCHLPGRQTCSIYVKILDLSRTRLCSDWGRTICHSIWLPQVPPLPL